MRFILSCFQNMKEILQEPSNPSFPQGGERMGSIWPSLSSDFRTMAPKLIYVNGDLVLGLFSLVWFLVFFVCLWFQFLVLFLIGKTDSLTQWCYNNSRWLPHGSLHTGVFGRRVVVSRMKKSYMPTKRFWCLCNEV